MVPTINAFLIAVMAATFSGEEVSEDIHRFLEGQRGKLPKEWEEDAIEAIAQELLRGRKPKRRVPKGWVSRTRYLTNVPEVVRWRFEMLQQDAILKQTEGVKNWFGWVHTSESYQEMCRRFKRRDWKEHRQNNRFAGISIPKELLFLVGYLFSKEQYLECRQFLEQVVIAKLEHMLAQCSGRWLEYLVILDVTHSIYSDAVLYWGASDEVFKRLAAVSKEAYERLVEKPKLRECLADCLSANQKEEELRTLRAINERIGTLGRDERFIEFPLFGWWGFENPYNEPEGERHEFDV